MRAKPLSHFISITDQCNSWGGGPESKKSGNVGGGRGQRGPEISLGCVVFVLPRDTETGDPARLSSKVAGRRGLKKWKSVQWGKKYFVLSWLEQPRQDKSLLYGHNESSEPTKEGTLSFVLFESPFTSVSPVGGCHPSLSLWYFHFKGSCSLACLWRDTFRLRGIQNRVPLFTPLQNRVNFLNF